ncbi:MAG TPA: 4-hydroxybenzoate octaprenyltransferase [Caulobacteraceae bacterium]|nr:4-hydroxybenzoate octaprenyltransferase [Caulobacteraceae bacterium]
MSASSVLPDARPDNWVDRLAPERLRPWLKLGRFDRPVGIWLLLLPGLQGLALAFAERGGDWRGFLWLAALFALGAALMRAAGCAYNDVVDRKVDAQVARTAGRPVASGRISVRQAWAFLVGCSLAAFAILLSFNPFAIALGAGSLGLVAAYPFMKRITWWPQAWLGLTFNWGALLGYAAATGTLGPAALLLYAAGVFWTLGYDTIYALQDVEDDALVGVKSTARRLGSGVPRAVMLFYGLSAALALGAWWAAGLGPAFLPVFALFAAQLLWQARRVKIDDGALALRLFKSNREAGLLLAAALLAGAWRP